ncbi:tetratricopeptide repeat-containing diguanylate cyclase [Deinococcus cellulosilyticus]|uniref:GGDEF domain-containing protein n=1 Tax=Deinococcus cellulosilyticus (strain DSM 18568 / NBRC 106333 / KACC 11606 / 5516J-15) TaxID=1223518 RepID=A0A511N9T6_DEIC1|nr:tetratricopeptide repeat-containing diguanylate cyclase [Deinococcus cellulosilyticus]GEM49593.1 hypothetical protein DC3_52280 [Deinococcus cellulosilyticus NBRC 106333 = KACC 11606]
MDLPSDPASHIPALLREAQEWAYQEPQRALQQAQKAFQLLSVQVPLELQLRVREVLINSLAIVGDQQEGLRHASELLALAAEAGDLPLQATANQQIATMLATSGQYEQSLPYFQAARTLSEGTSPGQYATATLNLADTLEKLGRLQDARQVYQGVLSLSTVDEEVEVVQAYASLSLVGLKVLEFELGQLEVRGLQEEPAVLVGVVEAARKARDRFLELYAHALLTRLQVHLGHLSEAERAFEEAWKIAEDLNQPRAWACACEARAYLYCLQDDHPEAMGSFEEAAAHLESVASSGELLQLLNSYVRYLRFWKKFEKAFEVLWKLHILDRAVRTDGVILQAQLVTLQMQIELARKENELHVLHVQELQHLQQQLQEQNQLLERLSRMDELTGVYNRRHAVHLLRELGAGPGCVLLLFDVDHFKRVNDSYGHSMGDTVLRGITSVVQAFLGDQDVFGRLGGEEFVVALAGRTVAEGERVALQICEAVAASVWHGIPGHQVTLSIGVAPFVSGTLEAALHLADEALYAAKARGRNCVVVVHTA